MKRLLLVGVVALVAGLLLLNRAVVDAPSPLFSQLGLWATVGGGTLTIVSGARALHLV